MNELDKKLSIGMWTASFIGLGPIVAVIAFGMTSSEPGSKLRSDAKLLLLCWAFASAVFFPLVLWAFAFGGSREVFVTIWVPLVIGLFVLVIVKLISAIRTPSRERP